MAISTPMAIFHGMKHRFASLTEAAQGSVLVFHGGQEASLYLLERRPPPGHGVDPDLQAARIRFPPEQLSVQRGNTVRTVLRAVGRSADADAHGLQISTFEDLERHRERVEQLGARYIKSNCQRLRPTPRGQTGSTDLSQLENSCSGTSGQHPGKSTGFLIGP